jgi:hypothetical protein
MYIMRCTPVEVIPRSLKNCTEEIPELSNGTEVFVDPISYVIKTAESPVHCNDITSLRCKVEGQMVLQLRPSHVTCG